MTRAALLRKGLKLDITANEPVSLDVQLLGRPRFLRGARSGDVVLTHTKLALGNGKRTVKLKVLRTLRRAERRGLIEPVRVVRQLSRTLARVHVFSRKSGLRQNRDDTNVTSIKRTRDAA